MSNSRRNRIIGITGGIGAGKSMVSRILSLRGYTVYDCDSKAKLLMTRMPLSAKLRQLISDDLFAPDGSLNRTLMAERIFSDEKLLKRVNEAVHAAVRDDIRECASEACKDSLFFVESAILATSQLHRFTDEVWLVEAPLEIRLQRALNRNPEAKVVDIEKRIKAQEKETELLNKDSLSIIDNSGTDSVLLQVEHLLECLTLNENN